MAPAAPFHDSCGGALRDPEAFGKVLQPTVRIGIGRSDVAHVIDGEPRPRMLFSPRVASLHRRIPHVVALCAEEQVGRIEAIPDIAVMQHAQSCWNGTDFQFVGVPMHAHKMSAPIRQGKCSIALLISPSGPQPARLRLLHAGPEASGDADDSRIALCTVEAGTRAVLIPVVLGRFAAPAAESTVGHQEPPIPMFKGTWPR